MDRRQKVSDQTPDGTSLTMCFYPQHRCFHKKPGIFNKTVLSFVEYLEDLWKDQWEHGLMKTPVLGKTHV